MDSDSEMNLILIISKLISPGNTHSEDVTLIIHTICLVRSMDLDSQPRAESKLMTLVRKAVSVFSSMDMDSQPKPLSDLVSLISEKISLHKTGDSKSGSEPESDSKFMSLVEDIRSLQLELISLIHQIAFHVNTTNMELQLRKQRESLGNSVDSDWELMSHSSQQVSSDDPTDSESKLISLITKLMFINLSWITEESEIIALIIQIISLVRSMALDLQLKPQSELMSLVTQTIFVLNSMDMDSPSVAELSDFISLITQRIFHVNSVELELKLSSLVGQIMSLMPEPELISLIHRIFSLVMSMSSKQDKLISLCPQVQISFEEGKCDKGALLMSNNKWDCLPGNWEMFRSTGGYATHFFCRGCKGQNHEEYNKAPLEIKQPLHPKHSLQLVSLKQLSYGNRCYCCDQHLKTVIYYCSACDYALNIACAEKPRVLSIDHPKWHEHKLALFPSQASFRCNVCALQHSSCPFYICPPCDFVVHQSCISLPRVIRISRHLHRISVTPSFDQGDWSCGVCRRKIDNDYGGYSCIKDGCLYAAHSRCGTQENVWDGIDLEGEPEEIEEEILEPFVRISDGIIQHFSHQHHHLRLDENTNREYDEDKQCQACITPIYHGNFYSCMQCEFILHETCANLSRKLYHPLHPHLLTLKTDRSDVTYANMSCSTCPWLCTGYFYQCDKGGCDFMIHVPCATISEPLVHPSHMHPLFLTSKPGERRACSVCKDRRGSSKNETFNCIEECDFALCFACATLPQKVRYKHDKHMLTLSYGDETSSAMAYWCEVCEEKVFPKQRFYRCDEYCCVTLHIECLIEKDLYMKPGSSLSYYSKNIEVWPNNHRMSRPFCSGCFDCKRCPQKFVFVVNLSVYCSISCCFDHPNSLSPARPQIYMLDSE